MNLRYAVIIIILLAIKTVVPQTRISLLNMDEVNNYLSLTEEQYVTINSKVQEIKRIIDEDKKNIAGLKERFASGDEPGFFEKIKVKKARDNRSADIKKLIKQIERTLNNAQKERFKEIDKPYLKALSKEEMKG